MPASQLKQLKASLRNSGATGPQKSKKQKQRDAKDGTRKSQNQSRAAALEKVREQSNPFEVKLSSRGPKHQFATNAKPKSAVLGRPGITKGRGEQLRREKLLPELQQRRRTGGIVDRRFGENDPSMTPDERALERFMREKQRAGKRSNAFDLEADLEDDDGDDGLTHGGQALSFAGDSQIDDYEGSDSLGSGDDDADTQAARRAEKRRRFLERSQAGGDDGNDADQPDRKKSKHEVMKEVIAKSKLHKYERQQAKEDDDELRTRLDAGMKDIVALLHGQKPKPDANAVPLGERGMNPDRAALLNGADRKQLDKEYEMRLHQLAQDARGKPTSRTKTEEELAAKEAERLKELEEARLRRMRGEDDFGEDAESDLEDGEYDEFGLGQGLTTRAHRNDLDVEDEDEFDLDDDLIASGSELDLESESGEDDLSDGSEEMDDGLGETDDEADFVAELAGHGNDRLAQSSAQDRKEGHGRTSKGGLAFTFTCPVSHDEFLEITKDVQGMELVTVVQRIRTLYNPKLDGSNKVKLAAFAAVLVDHIAYLGDQSTNPSMAVLEQLIRHVHSLAKSFPVEVGNAFRTHIIKIRQDRPLEPTTSDLILFTAIGQIFSTSDHFHQVVTPAMLDMACYLGQTAVKSLGDLAKCAYVCTQFLHYQRLSKRYIPEALNIVATGLEVLAQTPLAQSLGQVPRREGSMHLRITKAVEEPRKINFSDIGSQHDSTSAQGEELKHSLLELFLHLAAQMAELWVGKSAYIEIMTPIGIVTTHLLGKTCIQHLSQQTKRILKSTNTKTLRLLSQARLDRQPLALHNHRPLPIKQSIPKFEDDYRPDKHYDPDRDRADMAKLKKEHKRERKGALRELRKDAHFIARENLRQKKVADAEYESKYKRLVAEIQGEEAHEAKEYEREKRMRQGKR